MKITYLGTVSASNRTDIKPSVQTGKSFSGFTYPAGIAGDWPIWGDFDPDANEPTVVGNVWIFRRKCFRVQDAQIVPPDEIALRIKRMAYRAEKALEKIQKEVAAFENFERLPSARRERIPESVRLFVWQRDCGVVSNVVLMSDSNLTTLYLL